MLKIIQKKYPFKLNVIEIDGLQFNSVPLIRINNQVVCKFFIDIPMIITLCSQYYKSAQIV